MRTAIGSITALSWAAVFALALGCDPSAGSVGAPCDSAEDCDDGLTCDEHDGKASCQQPHGHDSTSSTSEGHDSDHHESESTTDHHESESTTDHHDSESTTDHHDSESTTDHGETDTESGTDGSATDGTGTGGDGAVLEQACTDLCGCVQSNCSSFADYPFASDTSCMTFCMDHEITAVGCFTDFCQQVPDAGDSAEHACEHAWGDLGALEC